LLLVFVDFYDSACISDGGPGYRPLLRRRLGAFGVFGLLLRGFFVLFLGLHNFQTGVYRGDVVYFNEEGVFKFFFVLLFLLF